MITNFNLIQQINPVVPRNFTIISSFIRSALTVAPRGHFGQISPAARRGLPETPSTTNRRRTAGGRGPMAPAPAFSFAFTGSAPRRKCRTTMVHRCSRCGEVGHNVRNCLHSERVWFAQRCSACGEPGHNARNCASVHARGRQCPVCGGRGTLPCGRCGGSGRTGRSARASMVVARTPIPLPKFGTLAPDRTPPTRPRALNAQQREWARLARARAAEARGASNDANADDALAEETLVGGESVKAAHALRVSKKHPAAATRPGEADAPCPRCSGLGYLCCLSCSE